MPQLMPFMWMGSVFMSFMLLIMLMLMYNYISSFFGFELSMMINGVFNISW